MKSAIGVYFVEINAETFTRPLAPLMPPVNYILLKVSALYSLINKKMMLTKKLQVGLFKKMADGCIGTFKAQGCMLKVLNFLSSFV